MQQWLYVAKANPGADFVSERLEGEGGEAVISFSLQVLVECDMSVRGGEHSHCHVTSLSVKHCPF